MAQEKKNLVARTGLKDVELLRRLNNHFDNDTSYDLLKEAANNDGGVTLDDGCTVIIYSESSDRYTVIGSAKNYPVLLEPVVRQSINDLEDDILEYQFSDGTKFTVEELSTINYLRTCGDHGIYKVVTRILKELVNR